MVSGLSSNYWSKIILFQRRLHLNGDFRSLFYVFFLKIARPVFISSTSISTKYWSNDFSSTEKPFGKEGWSCKSSSPLFSELTLLELELDSLRSSLSFCLYSSVFDFSVANFSLFVELLLSWGDTCWFTVSRNLEDERIICLFGF